MKIKKLLIVEDQDCFIRIYTAWIARNFPAFEIESTVNPENVIDLIKYNKYDIVIMDVDLGKTSGKVIAEKIRKFGFEVYILAATGFSGTTKTKDGILIFDQVLIKPFGETDLIAALKIAAQ